MVAEGLLELFDEQMRRPNQPDGRYVGDGWSAVIRPPADGDVEPLVARMREVKGHVEWKYYAHDLPPICASGSRSGARAGGRGDGPRRRGGRDRSPPPTSSCARTPRRLSSSRSGLRPRHGSGFPENAVAVVACVDGRPVPAVASISCRRRVRRPVRRRDPAGVPRARAVPRESGAARGARARGGYRWLYVDALPTSRPILERLGFVTLTTTTPFVIPPAAR